MERGSTALLDECDISVACAVTGEGKASGDCWACCQAKKVGGEAREFAGSSEALVRRLFVVMALSSREIEYILNDSDEDWGGGEDTDSSWDLSNESEDGNVSAEESDGQGGGDGVYKDVFFYVLFHFYRGFYSLQTVKIHFQTYFVICYFLSFLPKTNLLTHVDLHKIFTGVLRKNNVYSTFLKSLRTYELSYLKL